MICALGRFDEALQQAREHESQLKRHNIMQVGEQYLHYLMAQNEYAGE